MDKENCGNFVGIRNLPMNDRSIVLDIAVTSSIFSGVFVGSIAHQEIKKISSLQTFHWHRFCYFDFIHLGSMKCNFTLNQKCLIFVLGKWFSVDETIKIQRKKSSLMKAYCFLQASVFSLKKVIHLRIQCMTVTVKPCRSREG